MVQSLSYKSFCINKFNMYPKICIVLLNYNGWADTIECLESLFRIDYPNYKVIVVDNDSPNDSMHYIKAWADGKLDVWRKPQSPLRNYSYLPVQKPISYKLYNNLFELENRQDMHHADSDKESLVLIQTGFNGGFAFGNNVAIKYAWGKKDVDYVLLLNNDTVVEKDFLTKMLQATLSNPNIRVTGCKIYYYDYPDKIWFNGASFNEWTGMTIHRQSETDVNWSQSTFITGCCMLIQKDVFRKVGLLDESYFMYMEDLDLSYRIRQAGYDLAVAHTAKIWHKVGASSDGEFSIFSTYWILRNRVKFILKNMSLLKKITAIGFIVTTRFFKWIEYFLKGKKNIILAQLKGIKDGILMR